VGGWSNRRNGEAVQGDKKAPPGAWPPLLGTKPVELPVTRLNASVWHWREGRTRVRCKALE